jgi:class 3 adenylate cyclase
MTTAMASNAIVCSLFPAVVRDRLYQKAGAQPKPRISLVSQAANNLIAKGTIPDTSPTDRPIVDLVQNCTVMFADIAGFTSWSATRTPAEVFSLLETLYGAFDKIAKKRSVFKVEAIGDCYLAVTGLPEAQEDHAVRIIQFAYECLQRMTEIIKMEVDVALETSGLSMRFGLHSGSVSAGVLRGQKSRFQLFGDTVNTAARMESLGECFDCLLSSAQNLFSITMHLPQGNRAAFT